MADDQHKLIVDRPHVREAATLSQVDSALLPRINRPCKKAETRTMSDNKKSWTQSLPFPKRWLGYVTIKLIVLGIGVYLALRWKGVL